MRMVNVQCSMLNERAVELLQRLIEVPRISREEKAAADLLQDYMQDELGLEVKRMGNNLWSMQPNFDSEKQTLLLNAHIDTVKPAASWTRDPFDPSDSPEKIWGLGSNDDGGSLIALLMAYERLSQTGPHPCRFAFSATAEEEVSGRKGIELLFPELGDVAFGLIGEPTGMRLAVAERGLMVLDCTAHGKSGHAARGEGVNAIYKALGWIEWFRDYQFEKVSDLLGANKMSVTVINAGTQHNVVPDKCTFVVDVRTNELYSNQEVFDIIKSHVPGAEYRSTRLNSSRISTDHPLIQKLIGMGKKPFGSPTLSDQALMRFPSFKLGPGESSRSHTADEFIKISEIEDAIGTYISLLS